MAAYLPTTFLVKDADSPWGLFGKYLLETAGYGGLSSGAYFLGREQTTWAWLYLPVSVFFKFPLPFTILCVLAAVLTFRKKLGPPAWTLAPLGVYLAFALLGGGNKVCRHLMPVYPLLFLWAGAAAEWLWGRAWSSRAWFFSVLVFCLVWVWPPATALVHYPHALSYMNDLVPSDKKSWALGGMNWDLNQDVKALAGMVRRREWKNVKFANSNRVDPYFFGVDWVYWTRKDLEAPQPGNIYILNASLLQAKDEYLKEFADVKKSWVGKVPPSGWISDTWIYYEVSGEKQPDDSQPLNSVPYFKVRPYLQSQPTPAVQ